MPEFIKKRLDYLTKKYRDEASVAICQVGEAGGRHSVRHGPHRHTHRRSLPCVGTTLAYLIALLVYQPYEHAYQNNIEFHVAGSV